MASLKVGIVGLPNVGKSTLFNALLKKRVALSVNYPFATVEPNVGVIVVGDERLENLAKLVQKEENMSAPPPLIPAVVEFVDIAGLVKGASTGVGLGNKFLSHIREVDAIVHVLRDFTDPNIVREGSVSPNEDKLIIETELGLADLQTLDKLLLDKTLDSEKKEILNKIKEDLNEGRNPGTHPNLPLLSIKPVLYVYNVDENKFLDSVRSNRLEYHNDNELMISAKLEEEMADFSEEERKEYLKELGIEETGLERLIKKAYHLLGLISYLTAGPKEVRAWTIRLGSTSLMASGVIHTDFMKNFIRAQVIEYEKLIEAGSYKVAKDKGLIRTEGKDYIVKDGDVIEFLIG